MTALRRETRPASARRRPLPPFPWTLFGLLVVALGGPGCVVVKPYQRELLAKPFMQFHDDPDEETLDLHMLEAREGAAGGYGSAGGGCGCN